MSSSDPSHAYAYDLEEGDEDDDEASHDDYDEMPDDEDDDDDMDDDDEDDDEEDDVAYHTHQRVPSPIGLNALSGFPAGGLFRGPQHELPVYPHIPFSLSPLGFLSDTPFYSSHRRPARNVLRSVLLETFDSLSPGQGARLVSELDSFRLHMDAADTLSNLTSRIRGGLAVFDTRMFLGDDSSRSAPSAIHPILLRPPVAASNDASDATRSLFASIGRRSSSDRGPFRSPAEPVRDPQSRMTDSLTDIRLFLDGLDDNAREASDAVAEAGPARRGSSQPTDTTLPQVLTADATLPPTSAPSSGVAGMSSSPIAVPPVRRGSLGSSSATRPPAESTRAALHRAREIAMSVAAAVTGDTDIRSTSRQEVEQLAEYDLMRSVEPLNMPSSVDLLAGLMPSNRSPYERLSHRDRDREKVPGGVLKRWVYDPPSCGGDSLPAIFDNDFAQRSGRLHGRSTSSNPTLPLLAPQTHESVNQLSSKIISRLDTLLSDMATIDAKVAEHELKEQTKKEAEENERKAAEEKERKESEKEGVSDAESAEKAGVEDPDIAGPTGVENEASAESQDESGERNTEAATGTDTLVLPADEARPDAVMGTVDDEQVGTPPEQEQNEAAALDSEEEVAGTEPVNGQEGQPAPAPNDFAAVAAQRAAAAGISLDAPANVNPEVVAAATESTGIDPAFLSALPDEMRAEILTQYYEQIRTNAGRDSGASSSPSATTVNQDFLIALPPALRAEVLELEAEFQSRHQNGPGEGANASGTAGSGSNDAGGGDGSGGQVAAAEMDNATFLATLAPELREEILLTSGEAFIQSLPPSVAAEARVLREREASSRMPWRGGAGFPGFDGRRFPNGVRGPSHGHGRSGSRTQPREAPVYHWKKVENGWRREGPKAADEPIPSLKADGLSALIQLHLLRQGHYGKTYLFQVFSHACKNTASRELILGQLVQLITSSLSQDVRFTESGLNNRRELDRSRQHGTTVRRALEMLALLCKNDPVVAENLLGLPKSNEELAEIPAKIAEGTVMPQRHADISLATLVSLLDNPLFERSDSHLEQLVSLISILCLALPPTLCDNSDQKNGGSLANLRRRIADMNDELQGSMTVFLDTHDDQQGVFRVADDGDDDDDSEDDPFDSPDIGRPERESGDRDASNSTKAAGEGKDGEKAVAIPPQYRIPGFRNEDLVALTKVLLRQGCSDRTYERVSRSIGILGELVPIRITFVESLVKIAVDSGQGVHEEYHKLIIALDKATQVHSSRRRRDVIGAFSVATAANELTLLRVIKSLAALWEHEAVENAPKKTKKKLDEPKEGVSNDDDNETKEGVAKEDAASQNSPSDCIEQPEQAGTSTQRRFRPSMVVGLQGLWNSLDNLLELVSDEARLKEGKASAGARNSAPSAADVLNLNRMKSANRSLSPVLARLSPMIEAFLITHSADEAPVPGDDPAACETPRSRKRTVLKAPVGSPSAEKSAVSTGEVSPRVMEGQLSAFVERHRGPINALLRANPSLLETSFKGALRHPHAIDFDNKKAYFRNVIRRRSSEAHAGTIRLNNVRRERVFDDSYQQLRLRTPDEMKGRLHVQFNGEEGVDAGGVTREWYIILARQIFDPNYVLFTRSAAKAATYQPDKRSYINREHLENFRFVGRIIGKAIYDGQLLDAYFTRSFYKHILGLKPTYHDIEAQDPDYYKSLKWMLENEITGVFDYNMSAEYDEFGRQTVVDLVPNGRNIPVTEENKADYVRLVTEVRMTKTIEKQIEAFKEGFYELIPHDDVKIFNELELELLMSGLPDIDMADLKANVEYTGYTASSPQINWFWRCVSSMGQEDLARLVMFVTGTSKVPLEGFGTLQGMNGVQKFHIHRVAGNSLRLPSAHTCFNQLDLPEYSSAEVLSERLLRAVRECSVGFGFA